ncbi:MAG TPA: peptidoglycan-binding domain-containing protein [Bryobacteraceae bacterium]|nr:peptidoglycan-binding domain-containing protein [Bryobacteraceae bacterium]
MQPAPERYMEIQQALITKGYMEGPATGAWNADWTGALKRFQRDQNLDASGKLTSLSLMALGLGPKRDAVGIETETGVAGQTPAETSRVPQ